MRLVALNSPWLDRPFSSYLLEPHRVKYPDGKKMTQCVQICNDFLLVRLTSFLQRRKISVQRLKATPFWLWARLFRTENSAPMVTWRNGFRTLLKLESIILTWLRRWASLYGTKIYSATWKKMDSNSRSRNRSVFRVLRNASVPTTYFERAKL